MSKNKIIWLTGQPGSGKTTLANSLSKEISKVKKTTKIVIIDGDDLRDITFNKDYSRKGREKNIRTAQKIAHFLFNKDFFVIVSLVAPYKELREKFKAQVGLLEVFIHTTEIRGREKFFAEDYEKPTENYLNIDTTNKTIKECVNEILNVYWQMATVA
jgi:adenylylsulfate kinase-like enzyme